MATVELALPPSARHSSQISSGPAIVQNEDRCPNVGRLAIVFLSLGDITTRLRSSSFTAKLLSIKYGEAIDGRTSRQKLGSNLLR